MTRTTSSFICFAQLTSRNDWGITTPTGDHPPIMNYCSYRIDEEGYLGAPARNPAGIPQNMAPKLRGSGVVNE